MRRDFVQQQYRIWLRIWHAKVARPGPRTRFKISAFCSPVEHSAAGRPLAGGPPPDRRDAGRQAPGRPRRRAAAPAARAWARRAWISGTGAPATASRSNSPERVSDAAGNGAIAARVDLGGRAMTVSARAAETLAPASAAQSLQGVQPGHVGLCRHSGAGAARAARVRIGSPGLRARDRGEHQTVEEAPPIRRAVEEQAVLRRRQPEGPQMGRPGPRWTPARRRRARPPRRRPVFRRRSRSAHLWPPCRYLR